MPHHAQRVLPGKVRAGAWIDARLGAPHAQVTTAGRVRKGVWSYFTRKVTRRASVQQGACEVGQRMHREGFPSYSWRLVLREQLVPITLP